jgi:hypothetical protein
VEGKRINKKLIGVVQFISCERRGEGRREPEGNPKA